LSQSPKLAVAAKQKERKEHVTLRCRKQFSHRL